MNKLYPVILSLSAAFLLIGSALAQTTSSRNPSAENADRIDRHCTSSTLATDPSAPCSDDALNSRTGATPVKSKHRAIRPATNASARSGKTTQPGPGKTATTSNTAKGTTPVQEPAR